MRPLSILIVEDQSELRKLIRMTLDDGVHTLHEAADGDEALEMLQTLRPDVVVLDIMMPGTIDGLALCSYIKGRPELAAARVALLSACGQKLDIELGHEAGADAYLVKPFSPQELFDLIESWSAQ